MQIEDLLLQLREEFALDVPAVRAAAAQWRLAPDQAAPAARLLDFLSRSTLASEVMGLHGFAGYLQQIHAFIAAHQSSANKELLAWLEGWLDPALAYLDQPATLASVSGLVEFLTACPEQPDVHAIEALAGLLLVMPSLPDGTIPHCTRCSLRCQPTSVLIRKMSTWVCCWPCWQTHPSSSKSWVPW